MKAKVTIGDRKPDEVNITGILYRPHQNKIVIYLQNISIECMPQDLSSIIIGENGKATITPIDLQIISEIYSVMHWLEELELPVFEFNIN